MAMPMGTKMTTRLAMAAVVVAAAGALPACAPTVDTIPVDAIAYRPDGSLVLFNKNGIYVYADGRLVTESSHIQLDALAIPPSTAAVPNPGVLQFSLSADGNTAAVSYSGFGEHDSRVAVYRIPDGRLRMMLQIAGGESSGPIAQALSPDGNRIFAAVRADDWLSTVIDVGTGAPLWTTNDPLRSPIWSPDGATLYAVRWDLISTEVPTLDALDASSGAVTWTMDLHGREARALALTGDGTLLASALDPPRSAVCPDSGDCPPSPTYPFWSTADGLPTTEFPALPHTWPYATFSSFDINFACNATDTCAVGLNFWDDPARSNFIRISKTDGSVLRVLPTPTGKAINTMAISPDGAFVTIANPYDLGGGATVYRIEDGAVVGSRLFPKGTR
jgi:WD40 repeat protein